MRTTSNEVPFCCGNSSVGRARPCQGRGREFESRFPLQILNLIVNITFSGREKRDPLWARDRVSASWRISFPAPNFYTPDYCDTFALDSMRPLWARDRVSAIASQRVQICFPSF